MPNFGYDYYSGAYAPKQPYGYDRGMYSPPMQPMQPMQSQMQQPMYLPLTYTNGLIGAKAFAMSQPNSTVYLLDSDSNDILYVKSADNQFKCTLDAYRLTKIPLEQVNRPQEIIEYATKSDVQDIKNMIANMYNSLKGGVVNESNANTNAINANGEQPQRND